MVHPLLEVGGSWPVSLAAGLLIALGRSGGPPDAPRPVSGAAAVEASARGSSDEIHLSATGLGALRADPLRWLGREAHFVLQLDQLQESWDPWISRFGPADWLELSAWPDEAFTWESTVYDDPAPRLFVRRGSPLADLLRATDRYGRLEAVGVVREVFLGEPWIELQSLRPLALSVGEGTILHVERGLELLGEGSFELADEQLQRALDAPLPDHDAAEIDRLRAQVQRAREAAEEEKGH